MNIDHRTDAGEGAERSNPYDRYWFESDRENAVAIVERMIRAAHRARIALDELCVTDEFVAHEVLLLRAIRRRGEVKTGRELARALGWSPGRVSDVTKALLAKEYVERAVHPTTQARGVRLTHEGSSEASSAEDVLCAVAMKMLERLKSEELAQLAQTMSKVDAGSEGLWRVKRSVYGS